MLTTISRGIGIIATGALATAALTGTATAAQGTIGGSPVCSATTVAAPTVGGPWTATVTGGTVVDAEQASDLAAAAAAYADAATALDAATADYQALLGTYQAAYDAYQALGGGTRLVELSMQYRDDPIAAWGDTQQGGIYEELLSYDDQITAAVEPGGTVVIPTDGAAASSWTAELIVATGDTNGGGGGAFTPAVTDPEVTMPTAEGLYRVTASDETGATIAELYVSVGSPTWMYADMWRYAHTDYQDVLADADAAWAADPEVIAIQEAGEASTAAEGEWRAYVGTDESVALDQDYWLEQTDEWEAFETARDAYLAALGLDADAVLAEADAIYAAQTPEELVAQYGPYLAPADWTAAYRDALNTAISSATLASGATDGDEVAVLVCGDETATVAYGNGADALVVDVTVDGATTDAGTVTGTGSITAIFSGYSSGYVDLVTLGAYEVTLDYEVPEEPVVDEPEPEPTPEPDEPVVDEPTPPRVSE